ncbi:glutamine amidotransferase [Nesterenkonia sphaerica]|uniref:glutamine amidotransferase n=1 Tax=Nesterenkonia sphaerica TaxID=1804988 RepID=UPI001FB6AFF9|nr:glutamine amidotransferase [Nesterenkonia sphaerica]
MLYERLGPLMAEMLQGIVVRGPDSAGVAIYGDKSRCPAGQAAVSLLNAPEGLADAVARELPGVEEVHTELVGETTVLTAATSPELLSAAVAAVSPESRVVGMGEDMVIYKGIGNPNELARTYRLQEARGWQGIAHTRMATESAINAEGCHPFSVGVGVSLVHNGSFSNYASIRRELEAEGITFDSHNDTEVGARFVASRLAKGDDLSTALTALRKKFDGFYTLLVTTEKGFAVARDEFACKPAIIAEHPRWVAMASEFQALAMLPGIDEAHVFEPLPGRVYAWSR